MPYKDKEKQKKAQRESVNKRRKSLYDLIDVIKDRPCADCKNKFHPVAMDFDHLPEHNKSFNISRAANRNYSIESVLEEIKKCEVVCSNCHRIRTFIKRGGRK